MTESGAGNKLPRWDRDKGLSLARETNSRAGDKHEVRPGGGLVSWIENNKTQVFGSIIR